MAAGRESWWAALRDLLRVDSRDHSRARESVVYWAAQSAVQRDDLKVQSTAAEKAGSLVPYSADLLAAPWAVPRAAEMEQSRAGPWDGWRVAHLEGL